MTQIPLVDYRRTSARPSWEELPAPVRDVVEEVVGEPALGADPPVRSGFSNAFAARVHLADRDVFVKAASPDNQHVVGAVRQEAYLLARLPAGTPAPTLLGSAEAHGWPILVLRAVDGDLPGLPWTTADADLVHDACLQLADVGTPAPPGLVEHDFAASIAQDDRIQATATSLASADFAVPQGIPGWLAGRGSELRDLVLACGSLTGNSLVHGDLRPDNTLITSSAPRRTVIFDWNWLSTGPGWVDYVGQLPMMAWQGIDVDVRIAASPLCAGVAPEDIDAFLAAIAAYMLSSLDQPPMPGCLPAVRHHQHLMARMFLAMLAARRGWATERA